MEEVEGEEEVEKEGETRGGGGEDGEKEGGSKKELFIAFKL